jgi:hypothetical protein
MGNNSTNESVRERRGKYIRPGQRLSAALDERGILTTGPKFDQAAS